ncbi:MAG: alpha/beta fold hydrolase [Thermoplasmata archaeon]
MVRQSILRLDSGRKLQIAEEGELRGLPIFSLHGSPGSRMVYAPFSADAAAKGIRLISYDRPGYGASSPAPGRRVVDEAANVAAIADDLGIDRFAVWGFSGGGAPALACAAALPRRVVAAASLAGVAPYPAEGLDWFAGMTDSSVADTRLALDDPRGWDLKCRGDRELLLAASPDQ